jgi:hypothetical protein
VYFGGFSAPLAYTSLDFRRLLMKLDKRLIFSSLASLILATAVYAIPNPTHPNTTHEQAAAEAQSVSGKIASVGKSSFTLTLASNPASQPGSQFQEATPKTMRFMIDKNTTVDGNLKVGSDADVTYRDDGGQHVAISVRVTP